MKPEELLIIAESLYPDALETGILNMPFDRDECGVMLTDDVFFTYDPMQDKRQAWELMQAYRVKLKAKYNYSYSMASSDYVLHRNFFASLESPETLCAAYLKLIKGEGEAS